MGMDLEEMRPLIERHGAGEMTRDWDLSLSTMTSDCVYQFFPYRLQVVGVEAQTTLWDRFFPASGAIPCFDTSLRVYDGAEMTEYVTADSHLRVTSSSLLLPDGTRLGSSHVTRFDFRDGLISREMVFFDATIMRWVDAVFDDEFRALPGVTQL
jgi:hypothetical protein